MHTCLNSLMMADMSTELQSSLLFSQVYAVVSHAHEHVNVPECMEHYRVYTDLENQLVCDKCRVIDTDIDRYHYSARGGRYHDQCGARSGSPQL